MRVALVWPHGNDFTYSIPLGLGYIISNCRAPGVEYKIFDGTLNNAPSHSDSFRRFLKDYAPDVVGVSCWSKTYQEARKIVAVVKNDLPEAVSVLGGIHPTAYAAKTLSDSQADYILAGEAEFTFQEFVKNLRDKEKLLRVPGLVYRLDDRFMTNPLAFTQDLDTIAYPDYDAIELERYYRKGYRYFSGTRRSAPIWMTRGCPYSCKFCTAPQINGHKIRRHSVDYGIEWISMLYYKYKVRHVNIIDDNFAFQADYTKSFCEALIKKNFQGLTMYTANGIRAQRVDFETLKLMKRAGWKTAVVAPESGSRRVLKLMKKDLDPDMWPAKAREIRSAGLVSIGLFLIGYPGETTKDIRQTEALMKKCDFDHLGIQYFQPMPGTPVYDELVKKGEIQDTLLPGTTSGRRVYVSKGLENFNFARFAFRMYLYTFFRHPVHVIQMMLGYNPVLIIKRLMILGYDALVGLKTKGGQRPISR